MLFHSIPVSHSGNVIRYSPRLIAFILKLRWQHARDTDKGTEQITNDPSRLASHAQNLEMLIEMIAKKAL